MVPIDRHQRAYFVQKQLMEAVTADRQLSTLAGNAFRSFVRAYATHSGDIKSIFSVKVGGAGGGKEGGRGEEVLVGMAGFLLWLTPAT